MKTCTKCKEEKGEDDFYIDGRNGKPMSYCKKCKYEQARNWVKGDKDYGKERYKKDKVNSQNRSLKRKYGITIYDYYLMLENQKGCCAICFKPEPDHKKLDVDHCHTTEAVRGLLCTSCNRLLGHAGDSVEVVLSAVKYLKSYCKSQQSLSKQACKRKKT